MATALMDEIGTEPFDDAEVAPDDIDPRTPSASSSGPG